MRKTYRSVKDNHGGINRKDILLTMDEKSSAFDAFYMQNIKQTKKELSCMGSYQFGVTSTKARKKKYVKRIVKETVSSPHVSVANAAYLTPNKSIRLNKAFDPFDLLLNSSPKETGQHEAKYLVSSDSSKLKFNQKGKTYFKRKQKTIKKYNYSSSSDSEKENSNEVQYNATSNASDIKMHELIVVKEPSISSGTLDESINRILKKLPLLNNKTSSSPKFSIKDSPKFKRNRLTKNISSPLLGNSPLCSTPFKEKYRSQSIFKFSPISIRNEDTYHSSANLSVDNEQNDINKSIVFVNKHSKLKCSKSVSPNNPTLVNNEDDLFKRKHVVDNDFEAIVVTHKPDFTEPPSESLNLIHLDNNKSTPDKDDFFPICNKSIFHITEVEPFLGFDLNGKSVENSNMDSSISKPNSFNENKVIESVENIKDVNYSIEDKTIVSQNSCSENDTEESLGTINCMNESITLKTSKDSQEDRESMYDTCNSEQSSFEDQLVIKEPIVKLDRINDDLFLKYYKKMPRMTQNSGSSNDYRSFKMSLDNSGIFNLCTDTQEDNNSSSCSDKKILSSNDDELESNDEEICISFVTTRRKNEITNNSIISLLDHSFDSGPSTEPDIDKTVISNKLIVCNTQDKSELDLSDIDIINDESQLQANTSVIVLPRHSKKSNGNNNTSCNVESKMSLKTTCSKLFRESMIPSRSTHENLENEVINSVSDGKDIINISHSPRLSTTARQSSVYSPETSLANCSETKPSIVLQPGKKWQRSLSIYRRITMMNDHFDHSILDAEPLEKKGRKYRQSVITTMEMQEKSLLHNESINSRRSTFVSKPSRSSFRIVKDPDVSRVSICNSTLIDDLKGFLTDECDDTIIELSKLSIADVDNEVTVLDLHENCRVTSAKDYVLRRCNQTRTIPFDECYPESVLKNCHKIGEGVYGEVFLWRDRDGRARVMKIVPVAGDIKVNGENQKDFHEIISEIVIAMELSALRAPIADIDRHFEEGKDIDSLDLHGIENATDVFNEVLAVRCVRGSYPARLLELWELYDETRGSENDSPGALPPHQQYLVLELHNAGQDLEGYQFNGADQAHALLLQIAFGLAVGEEACEFEHRDLHWGNVLIAPTEQKYATFVLGGRLHRVWRGGVRATIIDYSLSRVRLGADVALYNDLASDEGLFDARGDYQFEIYRRMRDKLGNEWKNYEPFTNILWLHYIVDKMITALRYKRTNTKIHKHYIEKLKGIKNRILDYKSATQFVLTDNEF